MLLTLSIFFFLQTNKTQVDCYWLSICDRDTSTQDVAPPETPSFISFIPLWVVAGGTFTNVALFCLTFFSVLAGLLASILGLLVLWKWYRNKKHRKREEIILDLEIN